MIKNIKKHWILIFIFLIFATIIVPIIINNMFKYYSPIKLFEAEWDAGDALGYYGTVLGAIATIVAIIITINYTNKQNLAFFKKSILEDEFKNFNQKMSFLKDIIFVKPLLSDLIINDGTKKLFSYIHSLNECNYFLGVLKESSNPLDDKFANRVQEFIDSIYTVVMEIAINPNLESMKFNEIEKIFLKNINNYQHEFL